MVEEQARLFCDNYSFDCILLPSGPRSHKRIVRSVRGFDRAI